MLVQNVNKASVYNTESKSPLIQFDYGIVFRRNIMNFIVLNACITFLSVQLNEVRILYLK